MQSSQKIKAVLLTAAVTAVTACGTYQAYPGAALPAAETAIIIGDYRIRANSPVGIYLRKIDGQVIPQNNSKIAVRPGIHSVLVDCYLDRPDNLTRHEVEVEVEAGQRYRFQPVFATGNWDCDSVKLVSDQDG